MGRMVNRRQLTLSVGFPLHDALKRLSESSGTPMSRLVEEFLNVEVLHSIADALDAAKRGESAAEVSSYMHSIVGRHVVAASEALGDLDKVVKEK